MRRLSSLSIGLSAFFLGQLAIAADPSIATRAGRFGLASAHPSLDHAARAAIAAALPTGADLDQGRVTELRSGERVVKLAQRHRGLPVVHRGAAVTFGVDDVARLVAARIEDDLPDDVTPRVSADDAGSIAAKRSGLRESPAPALVIWPTASGNKLVWAAAPSAIPGLPYAPVVVVDAMSGEVVLAYNAIRTLNDGLAYPSNPVKSPTLATVQLPVGPGLVTLDNALVSSQNCIDKKSVKSLFGFNVHTCDLVQTAAPDGNGDFLIPAAGDKDPEDAFSEVQMFHHVNRAYSFFRGFDASLNVNSDAPITTVSNLRIPQGFDTLDPTKLGDPNLPLVPFQNAFFAPADPIFSAVFGLTGGAMWFGQGPNKDYSFDGDVVYHEFTHAVVNATLKLVGTAHLDAFGASLSPGAMNEGLADYFSSAITGDPNVGEYATQDFSPGSVAIRTIDNMDTCPLSIGGEVHQDSTLFSGALWDARKSLPPAQQADFDAAVFTAMNSAPTGDLGFEDFAGVVLGAVGASPLGKTGSDMLQTMFEAHGVLPKCTRVLEWAGTTLKGPKDLQFLWFAPGTQTTGAKTKEGYAPGVIQVHDKLPAGATKLTVSFTKVDIGGGFGMMGTPFAPKVLVRFAGDPIQFGVKPLAANEVTLVDPTAQGKVLTAAVDVPAGAKDAYLMIGNAGQLDGAYTSIDIALETGPVDMSSSSSSSGGANEGEDVGGCGCAVPGQGGETGAAVAAIGLLGLVAARRKRRQKAR